MKVFLCGKFSHKHLGGTNQIFHVETLFAERFLYVSLAMKIQKIDVFNAKYTCLRDNMKK